MAEADGTSRDALRARLVEALEEVSEAICHRAWRQGVEHMAWEMANGRDPLLTSFVYDTRHVRSELVSLREAMDEWALPGACGETFVPFAEFEPLHETWMRAEQDRKAELDAEWKARAERDLDDRDVEVLRYYAAREDDPSLPIVPILNHDEQAKNLVAKGLVTTMSGSNWMPDRPTPEGRELLASFDAPRP